MNINQRCSTTKSLDEALCQNIDAKTLKPVDGGVSSYRDTVCCPGCINIGAIVGGAVGGFIVALVLGTIIVKFVRKQRASASKPRTSVTVVEMGATAPPPTVPDAPPVYVPQVAAPPSYSHGPAPAVIGVA